MSTCLLNINKKGLYKNPTRSLRLNFRNVGIVPVANSLRSLRTYIAVIVTERIILVTFILLYSDIQQYTLIICPV